MVCIKIDSTKVVDTQGRTYEITYGVTDTHYHYVSRVELIDHGICQIIHGYDGMELLDCMLTIMAQ